MFWLGLDIGTGGSRALLVGRKSHKTTYKRKSTVYDTQTLPLYIVYRYSKGRYKRRGAYCIFGNVYHYT